MAAFAGEGLNVVEGLGLGFGEVLAARLVFAEHDAAVEDVDAGIGALDVSDLLFEGGDGAAFDAVDGEEFGPERLCFGLFAGSVFPLLGEADGVGSDFTLCQTHGISMVLMSCVWF